MYNYYKEGVFYMKKFVSFILSLTLIIAAIPGLGVEAASSVLLNENFDDGESRLVADSSPKTEYVDMSTITGATGGNTSGKVLKVSKAASSTKSSGKAYIPFADVTGKLSLTYKALIVPDSGSLALGAVNDDG